MLVAAGVGVLAIGLVQGVAVAPPLRSATVAALVLERTAAALRIGGGVGRTRRYRRRRSVGLPVGACSLPASPASVAHVFFGRAAYAASLVPGAAPLGGAAVVGARTLIRIAERVAPVRAVLPVRLSTLERLAST